jgi:serine/threonine-protein kinase
MIGKTISHYRILEKLGEGGMGIVYKAEDTKLKRIVTLKFLPSSIMASEAEKTRFVHEAQAAAALDHPNICTVYEIDEADGQLFIAMAYVEGQSLKAKIEAGPLKLDEALGIAMQVAEGLQAAHEKKITHRDIKPANVMLTTKGQAKIMDFGLAKQAGRTVITKEGMTLGTVAYMSPEQARGEDVDHRTDIWAFGVVLYDMITGQHPFKGLYEQAVVYSILNENPEPLTGLRTGVPMELERIVNKAMAKNTNERYQHVDEMLVDVKTLKKKIEAGFTKERITTTTPPVKKRFPLYAGMATLLVLLIAAGFYLWQREDVKKEPIAFDSKYRIAVLPLANISPDRQDEYFADGMTEELISTLSNIGGLRVITLTSVMPYKSAAKSVQEIGRELKVGTVLGGSVRKAENAVRITVRLIDVVGQENLWSHDYNRELKDIFSIQTDIAQQVAEALQVRLLAGEQRQIAKKMTENSETYTLYLQGRYFWNQWREPALQKAITYFEQALAKDSAFALAYSGLADSYQVLGYLNVLPPKQVYPQAEAAALKALALDSTLGEAHLSLAKNRLFYDWDLAGAEKGVKRALELKASSADAHALHGSYLAAIGQFGESIAARKRAYELDPLSALTVTSVGRSFYYARQYDHAVEWYKKALELDSANAIAYSSLGESYEQLKRYDAAVEAYLKQKPIVGAPPETITALREAYATAGIRGYWQKEHDFAQAQLQRGPMSPLRMARIFIKLGEKDQLFHWLDQAFDQRSSEMVFLKVNPLYDEVRSDSRFVALLKRVGLEK